VRVLHVQKSSGMGGSERHLASLLPALHMAGHEVRMCVLTTGQALRFIEPLTASGVPVRAIPAGKDLNPRVIAALVRQIKSFRPDLVHTHLIHGDLHGQIAARMSGTPGVSSVHSAHSFYRQWPYRSAVRLSGRLAKRRIAISKHVQQFLEESHLTSPDRIRVVPYGIDAAEWTISKTERIEARRKWGVNDEEIAVGVAARLIANKGHDFLIEGFASALAKAPNLKLLVAGEGPLRNALQEFALNRLGESRFQFAGYLADMKPFFAACDVVVFPTMPELGEGFGLAALEAMAACRAVVATRVGSLPELVLHQETGLLVNPREVDGLAGCLTRLALDPSLRHELGRAGKQRAVGHYSLGAMVDRTTAVYDEALHL